MNPIVSYCIPDVSYCTVCDVVVAVVGDGSGWYNIMLIQFAMQLLLDMRIRGSEDLRI